LIDTPTQSTQSPTLLILLTALSVSIGWGIRGQFGHEYGAALAGAIGGMAIALLSGREDWRRRIHFFAALCAIGFAFGGSMSYMKTVAYAHSSDSATVIYGFFCVFVLGFIWAAPAGTGVALPAYLDRDELTKMFVPLSFVFATWYVQDVVRGHLRLVHSDWYEFVASFRMSAILAATVVILIWIFWRKYWGVGTSLILHMAIGWWVGNLVLIRLLHLDMNPPRGDTWAECLGLVVGILICCWQRGLPGVAFSTLCAGFLGGIGFSLGTAVKILVMSTGYNTNWHSVMEQTQGLFLGVALAIAMVIVSRRAPVVNEGVSDDTRARRWTDAWCVAFVLWLLTYLNFRRSPGEWVKEVSGLEPKLYGIPLVADLLPSRGFIGWFDIGYIAIGIAIIVLLILHLRRPLPFLAMNWEGRGQLFYLVFLWWIVMMNFVHVLPRFTPIRLVTEGAITINAVVCTILMMFGSSARTEPTEFVDRSYVPAIRKTLLYGTLGIISVALTGFGIKRACWGDKPAGIVNTDQIRFGPNNTNTIK
jgi:hypothetical protein